MYYKKKTRMVSGAVMVVLLVVWLLSYLSVNQKYAYEITENYSVGDAFVHKNCEVEVLEINELSAEELLQSSEVLTEDDMDMYGHTDMVGRYLVANLRVTNGGAEEVDTEMYNWILETGSDGNGCSILTDINCPEIAGLAAGETTEVMLIFFLREELWDEVEKYGAKIYTSLYPEVKYISYETDS